MREPTKVALGQDMTITFNDLTHPENVTSYELSYDTMLHEWRGSISGDRSVAGITMYAVHKMIDRIVFQIKDGVSYTFYPKRITYTETWQSDEVVAYYLTFTADKPYPVDFE